MRIRFVLTTSILAFLFLMFLGLIVQSLFASHGGRMRAHQYNSRPMQ